MKSVHGIPLAHPCSMSMIVSKDTKMAASDSLLSYYSLPKREVVSPDGGSARPSTVAETYPGILGYTRLEKTNAREALFVLHRPPFN